MTIRLLFRRGLLAAALAVALSGAAIAGDTIRTETRVELRTKAGQIESLTLDDLAVGEVKALRAESGTTVIASRGADGYLLEVGDEEFKLPDFGTHLHAMHDVEIHKHLGHAGDADGDGKVHKRVIVRHGDGDDGKRVVEKRVVKGGDDAALAEAHAIAEAHATHDGDGVEKIVVVRKHAGDAGAEGLAVLGDLDGTLPSLADPGNEGKRILVTRRVRHETTDATQ